MSMVTRAGNAEHLGTRSAPFWEWLGAVVAPRIGAMTPDLFTIVASVKGLIEIVLATIGFCVIVVRLNTGSTVRAWRRAGTVPPRPPKPKDRQQRRVWKAREAYLRNLAMTASISFRRTRPPMPAGPSAGGAGPEPTSPSPTRSAPPRRGRHAGEARTIGGVDGFLDQARARPFGAEGPRDY
jgi:hypothetical protein